MDRLHADHSIQFSTSFTWNSRYDRTHHDTQTNLKPFVFVAIWLQFMLLHDEQQEF